MLAHEHEPDRDVAKYGAIRNPSSNRYSDSSAAKSHRCPTLTVTPWSGPKTPDHPTESGSRKLVGSSFGVASVTPPTELVA